MRLLLDTHVFLWAVVDSRKLKAVARARCSTQSRCMCLPRPIWEIAIKARFGKLDGDPEALAAAIEPGGFLELPVTARHAARVEKLPLHHHDPGETQARLLPTAASRV